MALDLLTAEDEKPNTVHSRPLLPVWQLGIPRHLWIAASAWVSRIVAAAVQFIAIRLLLENLGLESYAVFALLTGLTGWFLLADFGVGVSIQNHLSEARALHASEATILLTGRLLAILLLLLSVVVLYYTSPLLAPIFLQSFAWLNQDEKILLFFVSGSLSLGLGLTSIVYKIWYAEQRGYLSNAVPAVTAVIGLLGLWFTQKLVVEHRILYCLLVFIGPTVAVPLGILIAQLARTWSPGRFIAQLSLPVLLAILKRGAGFWAFAVMAAITLQIDYIVISQFFSAQAIAVYVLSTKIFSLAFFFYNALLLALWPMFTEMLTRQNWRAVKSSLKRYLLSGMIFMAVCTLALMFLMPVAVRLLAPNQNINIPTTLILSLGFYQIIRVWTDTFSMLLQSMSKIKPFLILVPMQALISVVLQWTLAPTLGLIGIVMALSLSFLLTVTWGLPYAAHLYSVSKK